MATKNLGGRPPKYKSGAELQAKINEYFEQCVPEYIYNRETGEPYLVKKNNPTITGMALYLGFIDRRSIYDYAKNGRFSHIIKKATARVAIEYEKLLVDKDIKATGPIFALKNMGWSDQREVQHTGQIQHTHTIPAAAQEMLEKIKNDD